MTRSAQADSGKKASKVNHISRQIIPSRADRAIKIRFPFLFTNAIKRGVRKVDLSCVAIHHTDFCVDVDDEMT